jgi:uncharacterized DUF497 family protein
LISFDWDAENLAHIARHGVTAAEAEYVLTHPTLDLEFQDDGIEQRFKEAGATATGRVLEVVTTWRGEMLRVVTAYDASSFVANEYYRKR